MTYQEDVTECIQNDKNGLAVFGRQQIEQWFQDIGLNKINNLLYGASTGEVGHSPNCLFLSLVVSLDMESEKLHFTYMQ